MNEFRLIDEILAVFGGRDAPSWLATGPGDDAAVTRLPPGCELVSSIDAYRADVHFPAAAAPELIGYRCLMASLSDLAAMAATPAWTLVALSLPDADADWVTRLSRGIAEAAAEADAHLAGGNLTAGPLALTFSVHGTAPQGQALLRAGAKAGDLLCVSGPLGGAAAALANCDLATSQPGHLSTLEAHYWRPQPPFSLADELRAHASSCIDLSDGLMQDVGHLANPSGVCLDLDANRIPLAEGASLQQALAGSDDYALAFTTPPGPLAEQFPVIGKVCVGAGVRLNGEPVAEAGYLHFR